MRDLNKLFGINDLPADEPLFATYGPSFTDMICAMPTLTDEGHAACPEAWRDLTAYLHTLIEDYELSTEVAAFEAAVPVDLVRAYRLAAAI
jgi:hypothetical protein